MKFSLIICTYKRPEALEKLLRSVGEQDLYPDEILIIDGSRDNRSKVLLKKKVFPGVIYFKVPEQARGLTRQRNYGIERVAEDSEIICFLDDDVVLEPDYFSRLINTYRNFPEAIGVGGYIKNEVNWVETSKSATFEEIEWDGFLRKLGSRNLFRKRLGLLSNEPPGVMPEFSNGLSIGFLPPSGKVYPVEFFMGGVSSFRKEVFGKIRFSKYFKGYGLYEDMDFCLRASKFGQLYVNTGAQLSHFHETGGRPNQFVYGKMVLRNGWYVWRVKYPAPSLKARVKWNATALLLTLVRLSNVLNTPRKIEALTESLGRIFGWFSLLYSRPKPNEKTNEQG